jgi:hypothetical protein
VGRQSLEQAYGESAAGEFTIVLCSSDENALAYVGHSDAERPVLFCVV